ncbi:MAG: MmcQ/YjbR family DNA-binding protein [Acholeplasmatales bacterium]|nr:MmcQ/YjbR family DNA-binding protein [Acholeplasmatales bacterium]
MKENKFFGRFKVDFSKLEPYGFKKIDNDYIIDIDLPNNEFKAIIKIEPSGEIDGDVIEKEFNEVYSNIRVKSELSSFTQEIKGQYYDILNDIKNKCFKELYFLTDQANRITSYIINKYGVKPVFPWDDKANSTAGVFKCPDNDKWFGLIMEIGINKIKKNKSNDLVNVLNVKIDETKLNDILKLDGFYECYHMSKTKWVSILLNDEASDDVIKEYIDYSYNVFKRNTIWLVPANPKMYDPYLVFKDSNIGIWKQYKGAKIGDTVYLYAGAPISAIIYKMEVVEINIPYNEKMDIIKVKLIEQYPTDLYPFELLNKYGVTAIRGPRGLTDELLKYMNTRV